MLDTTPEPTIDVFISYARADGRAHAEQLDADLRKAGYSTWRDTRTLDPYQDFSAEIEMAIRASHYVVTCITPSIEANPDSFVRREIIYAQNKHKPVIPLIFPAADPPVLVNHLTWIPFFADGDRAALNYAGGLAELLDRLRDQPGPSPRHTTDDPYAEYLRDLYDSIVYFLNQTVFSLITLSSASDPDAVDTTRRKVLPLDFFARPGIDAPDAESTPFDNFHAAYDHFGGRVLLLGEPGAGKTTTLMAFAREMVAARQSDPAQPLPVLGRIASWDSQQQTPLVEWLAARIPALESGDLARLVDGGRALLLLDGLDELGASREEPDSTAPDGKRSYDPRPRFIHALPKGTPAVVTCRVKDYADIGEKIALDGAVTLHPLDDGQMHEYLREMPYLWDALASDDDLREAIFTQYIDQRYAHEERRAAAMGESLPFSLEEVYRVLGHVAMVNAAGGIGWYWEIEDVSLDQDYFDDIVFSSQQDVFFDLAVVLHLLVRTDDARLRFIHLLLRDTLAVQHALLVWESESTLERKRAITVLGHFGDRRALAPLISSLRDRLPGLRSRAAIALAKLGDMQAIEPLINAMEKDSDLFTRDTIAHVIGKFGEAGLVVLLNAVESADANMRLHAIDALAELGNAHAVEPLIHVMQDDPANWNRHMAAEALERIGTPEALAAVKAWRASQQGGDAQND